MRRVLTFTVLLLASALVCVLASASARPTRVHPAFVAKKRCKIVIKKIHGRKRKVRVCHTVKPPPPPPPPPPPIETAGVIVGTVSLGSTPASAVQTLAAGDGAVWASRADMDVARIDPASMKVVTTISSPILEWASGLAVRDGALWIADALPATNAGPQSGQLRKVDEATNQVVATIPVGRSPEGMAFTPGSVWTANHRSDEVEGAPAPHTFSISRVDLASNTETARIPVEHRADKFDDWDNFCCGPQGMTAGFGSVWVGDATSNVVYRIDPSTNTVIATISPPEGSQACGDLASDATAIWVGAGCDSTTIWSIDPQTNTVSKTVQLSANTGPVATGLGSVWALIQDWLVRIDPATGTVVGKDNISGINGLAVGDGVVWVGQGSKLLEIRPA